MLWLSHDLLEELQDETFLHSSKLDESEESLLAFYESFNDFTVLNAGMSQKQALEDKIKWRWQEACTMNQELQEKLKHKKKTYKRWKQSQVTQQECGDIVQVCRDGVRKGEVHLVLNLVRDMKGNKKGFYAHSRSKKKTRENVDPLLNEVQLQVTRDMEKAKVVNALFPSIFSANTCQIKGLWERW